MPVSHPVNVDPDNLPSIVDSGTPSRGRSWVIDCGVGPALEQKAVTRSLVVTRVLAHNIPTVIEPECLSVDAAWSVHRAESSSDQGESMNRERGIYVTAGHVI